MKDFESLIRPITMVDENGTIYTVPNVANKPEVTTTPKLSEVSRGVVSGHTPWSKLGTNMGLGSSVEDMWTAGGEYVFPTTAMGMEVVSSSADDAGDGTGVRTVRISYLNSHFDEKTETVTLNGTNAVPTVAKDIYRIQNFRAVTTGSGWKAAGTIDIRHLSDTPIYSQIATANTRAKNITWTVPRGKILQITNMLFSAASNAASKPVTFTTKATYDVISKQITPFFLTFTELIVLDACVDVNLEYPTFFQEGVSIKVSAVSPDGAAYGSVVLRGCLETL